MWRRVARWLLRGLYLGVLAALFVVSGYLAFSLFVRRGVTPVPSLVGLTIEEARARLADQGLALRHHPAEDRFAEEVPADRVLEQRPRAGSLGKRGGSVEVVLSLGERRLEVPDLRGSALAAAQVTLSAAGLQAGRTATVFSGRVPAGAVAAQQPAPGAEVERGAAVDLFVAGEDLSETYVMPDLVNRDYQEVRRFLERHALRVGSIKFEPYEGVDDPLVLRQYPLPGHPLRPGEVISLVVAAVDELEEVGG